MSSLITKFEVNFEIPMNDAGLMGMMNALTETISLVNRSKRFFWGGVYTYVSGNAASIFFNFVIPRRLKGVKKQTADKFVDLIIEEIQEALEREDVVSSVTVRTDSGIEWVSGGTYQPLDLD